MDEQKINSELNRTLSPNSLLVINENGIYRLFCPFKAVCIKEVELYSIGQEITVIAVKMSIDFRLVYIIAGKGYYHYYFMIIHIPKAAPNTPH